MQSRNFCSLFACILVASLWPAAALAGSPTPSGDRTKAITASRVRPDAVIVVTTFDPRVGADGQCSLIEAITNANDDAATHVDCPRGAGPDILVLSAGVYALHEIDNTEHGANGLPSITSDITIDGDGGAMIRAVRGLAFRIFHVSSGGALTLNDLTLSNGSATPEMGGGGIRSDGGTLTLNGCTVEANSAIGGNGGGILNVGGAVSIRHSTVTRNLALGGMGGGIYNENGSITVDSSQVSLNIASSTDSTARGGGLAGYADASQHAVLKINASVIQSNEVDAPDGSGGGIAISSADNGTISLSLDATLVRANLAAHGGGLWIAGMAGRPEDTAASINRSAIVGNRASGQGSGIASGAGIENFAANTVVANSTIADNAAAGTVLSLGGGISNTSDRQFPGAALRLVNVTLSNNSALTGGGGIATQALERGAEATVTMANTIIAGNSAPLGSNCRTDASSITSLGHNLEDDDTCGFNQPDDLVNTDPLLGELRDNGGPTPTHALLLGSPAIDAGGDVVCADLPASGVDQRGVARPQGAHCDIGAYEVMLQPLSRRVFLPITVVTALPAATRGE